MSKENIFGERKNQKEQDRRFIDLILKYQDIALDLDQVLVESRIPAARKAKKLYGLVLNPLEIGWNTLSQKLIEKGFDLEEAKAKENLMWSDPEIFKHAPPVKGALELSWYLQLLQKRQYIITARTPKFDDEAPSPMEIATHQSVQNHFPWIPPERVFLNLDSNKDRKVFKMKTAGLFRVYIEDHPVYARAIAEYSINTTVILINAVKGEDNYLEHDQIICMPSVEYLTSLTEPLVAQSY